MVWHDPCAPLKLYFSKDGTDGYGRNVVRIALANSGRNTPFLVLPEDTKSSEDCAEARRKGLLKESEVSISVI